MHQLVLMLLCEHELKHMGSPARQHMGTPTGDRDSLSGLMHGLGQLRFVSDLLNICNDGHFNSGFI